MTERSQAVSGPYRTTAGVSRAPGADSSGQPVRSALCAPAADGSGQQAKSARHAPAVDVGRNEPLPATSALRVPDAGAGGREQQAAVSLLRTSGVPVRIRGRTAAEPAPAVAVADHEQTEAELAPAAAEAQTVTLHILDIVGDSIWVAGEDARKVYTRIEAAFAAGHKVKLSFAGSGPMMKVFLYAILTPLYEKYGEQWVESQLTYVEVAPSDQRLLAGAIAGTKRYLANPAAYDAAWEEVMADEA